MTLLVAILGATAAGGLLLAASGWHHRPVPEAAGSCASRSRPVPGDRVLRAVAGGIVVLAVTRWPAAAAAAGAAGWLLSELAGGGSDRQRRTERTEVNCDWGSTTMTSRSCQPDRNRRADMQTDPTVSGSNLEAGRCSTVAVRWA